MNHLFNNWSFLITIYDEAPESGTYPGLPSGDDFMHKIIPNIWAFLVQFLAFVILMLVVFFVAYKPIKKMLRKRQDYVEGEISSAESKNKEAEQNKLEAEQNLLESHRKADEIVQEAKAQAINQQNIVLEKTNEEIAKMKLDAEKDIERKKEEAKEDIRKEIINVALDASKEVLGREVNEKDNKKLINDFIEEMEK